jgi:UDP-N-acetyl-D-glucosamine dehydrogenase
MISRSPFGETFSFDLSDEAQKQELASLAAFSAQKNTTNADRTTDYQIDRKTIVVQGLGFVGTAMAAALANAGATTTAGSETSSDELYNVIGIDLANEQNYWKIGRVNAGLSPVVSTDASLDAAYTAAHERGNLTATHLAEAYSLADVVVVDIHLDIRKQEHGNPHQYSFTYDGYLAALRGVAENVKPDALVLIETTVPPGTTEKVVKPLFEAVFAERGLATDKLKLAHSYERVMPGKDYLHSITNFYRVYSGVDAASRAAVREFLSSFINTADFPLTELHSTTASEMSKVLENSFRAANIAFMQEWTEFAQTAGVNLFDVIQAIRVRPTHRNIMAPGLGVGGYCLTKDSLLADWSYRNLFGSDEHLDVSLNAIGINDTMPAFTFDLLANALGGADTMRGKHVAILGVSYLNDVADTRYSPTETLYDLCAGAGAVVRVHDTLVSYWAEKDMTVETSLEAFAKQSPQTDAVIFAVRHNEYLRLGTGEDANGNANGNADEILRLFAGVRVVVDGMNIVSNATAEALARKGVRVVGVGKGHWEAR